MSGACSWQRTVGARMARLSSGVWFAIEAYRERYRLRRELDALDRRGELERTLSDSGLTVSDVPRLMHAHPHTSRQLGDMMRRLGIDRAALPRSVSVAERLRAMEWRCAECASWRECRAWLGSGETQGSYRAFCPNAKALDEIRCAESGAAGSASPQSRGILAELDAAKGEGR